jgi:hypothetical protein
MTPATIFAVAYLAGTFVGLFSGAYLPLWLSGAPAWAMAIAAVVVRPLGPMDWQRRWAMAPTPPGIISERLRRLDDAHTRRVRCLAHGLCWGGLAGAAATSMPAVVDLLAWPGYDDRGLGVTVAVLVAMGWLFGAAVDDEDEPLRPGLAGLFLYAVVVTLCSVPALWEVL